MRKIFILNLSLVLILALLFWNRQNIEPTKIDWLPKKTEEAQSNAGNLIELPIKAYEKDEHEIFQNKLRDLTTKIQAKAVIAVDKNTKQILVNKNEDQQLYPASTTKIITALVAKDLYKMDQMITITADDLKFDNILNLKVGEQLKIDDLIKALLILSANEVGMILANHSPAGYDDFVAQMNQKAISLNLEKSTFANPEGYDAPAQRTSAKDLTLASLELLRDPELSEIVATNETQIFNLDGRSYNLKNTNKLLQQNLPFRVKGVKTGTTSLANEALVSLLEKDGREILIVVLSTNNRYNDTINLANFIFENYVWQKAVSLH